MIYHTNAFSENAFSYDLNLTSRVSSGDATLAEYGHLADGTKICSVDGTGNGFQYRGSLIYAQTAGQSGSPVLTLDCALTSAGRIVRWTAADGSVSYRSLIHLRDHLGSVRAVVDGDTGTVIEASDYYPFSKRIPSPAAESAAVFGSVSVTKPAEVTADPNPHSVASTSSATVVTATTAIRLRSRATLKSTFRDFRRLLRLISSGITRMKPVTGSFERRYAV